jgi:uncharacterized protein YkwD
MKKLKWIIPLVIVIYITIIIANQYIQEKTPQFTGKENFTSMINTERAQYDLEPVTNNQELIDVASLKCQDMINRNYRDHQDPEGDYIWSNLPQNKAYGENLAFNYTNSYETVQNWLKSPTHKENIVNKYFKEVGHYTCFTGEYYITVQLFRG